MFQKRRLLGGVWFCLGLVSQGDAMVLTSAPFEQGGVQRATKSVGDMRTDAASTAASSPADGDRFETVDSDSAPPGGNLSGEFGQAFIHDHELTQIQVSANSQSVYARYGLKNEAQVTWEPVRFGDTGQPEHVWRSRGDAEGYLSWPVPHADVLPVPQPSSVVLIGSSLIGLAAVARRRTVRPQALASVALSVE